MVSCIVFGVGFLVFGLIFCTGKALAWLPGWTSLPREEQRSIRILPLCRNIGGAICLAGILLLLGGIFPAFREGGLRPAILGWFVLCIGDLVFIGKSKRYVRPTQ